MLKTYVHRPCVHVVSCVAVENFYQMEEGTIVSLVRKGTRLDINLFSVSCSYIGLHPGSLLDVY